MGATVLKTLYFEPTQVFDPEEPRLPTLQVFEMSNPSKDDIQKKQPPITTEPTGSPQNVTAATNVQQNAQGAPSGATKGATPERNIQVPPPADPVMVQELRLFTTLQLKLGGDICQLKASEWTRQQEHLQLLLAEAIRTNGRGNRVVTAAATTTTTTVTQPGQLIPQPPATTSTVTPVTTSTN